MSEPSLHEIAVAYLKAGWHPIELPEGSKAPPPDGRTGYGGSDMTLVEVEDAGWMGNIGLRMPVDVLGLDVDVYHGGDRTLDELLARCGALPPTWISHSGRNDGSGIRFYRVPPGFAWVASLAGIEIIQRVHRYAVVFPSRHPDGRPYDWADLIEARLRVRDELPAVEDLPELPWPWIAELSRAAPSDLELARSKPAAADELAAFIAAHNRADQPGYINTILEHFTKRTDQGYSRHDTMQHCLIWAMECVRAELASARPTLDLLAERWVRAVSPDSRRAQLSDGRRTTEWEAMVRHAVGKVVVRPEADIHYLRMTTVGPTMNPGPAAPNGSAPADAEVIGGYHSTLVTFHDLPEPFSIPPVTWHAEDLLCRDTHGELAGAEKSFKSYLGLCLDVGLAAGVAVLGHFPVAERQRVLVLVGEGGEGPFLRRLAEVCAGYGVSPASLRGWLRFTTDHASANSERFLGGIRRELETFEPALVHADPWYAYQPAATESNQLTSVGASLERVGDLCRAGGATALINHHFNRGVNGGLRQITGAGHAEWVDSWLLTQHREPPNLTAGIYRIRLDVGSRQWGGGSYDIDFTLTPAPFGRLAWTIREAIDDPAAWVDPLESYKAELLAVGRRMKAPQTRTAWIQRARGDDKKLRPALEELVADGRVVPAPGEDLWRPIPLVKPPVNVGDVLEKVPMYPNEEPLKDL